MSILNDLHLERARLPGLAVLAALPQRWGQALLVCLPRCLRHWWARRRPLLVVSPRGDDAELALELLGEREAVGAIDLRTGGPATIGDGRQPWSRVVLELPATSVLVRGLTLPVQVRDNLRQVIHYEMDRLTPFQPGEVYTDVRVVGPLARGTKVALELAVCRRDQVADWLDRLREAGAPATVLTWPQAWPGANLLPAAERPRRPAFGAGVGLLLLVLVLGLAGAALYTPLLQQERALADLQQQLQRLRAEAVEVEDLRAELERARLGSVEVLEHKATQPRMTDLLRDLTELLPDGTWVQTLNYGNGEVDLRGESSQATALIARLEQAPTISEVSFRSPVMQVATSGQERFHMAFRFQRASP